jgi:hypothetical protein
VEEMMADKNETNWQDKLEQQIKKIEKSIEDIDLDKKMKKLEKRVEDIGKRVEEKGEEFGKRMEVKAKEVRQKIEKKNLPGHNIFWGVALVAVGLIWLAGNTGWFDFDIPWFAIVLIVVGIYLVIRNWEKKESSEKDNPNSHP